jgi:hypothetical protein
VIEYYYLKHKNVIEFIDEYVDGCLTRFFAMDRNEWIEDNDESSLEEERERCPNYVFEFAPEDEVSTFLMLLELGK